MRRPQRSAVALVASADQSADEVLTVQKPGTYEFYCPAPGHKTTGMKGHLVVR